MQQLCIDSTKKIGLDGIPEDIFQPGLVVWWLVEYQLREADFADFYILLFSWNLKPILASCELDDWHDQNFLNKCAEFYLSAV